MITDIPRALVMGGSSGIGAETARLFAERGAAVVITGRARQRLDAVAARLGDAVTAQRVDATAPVELAALFADETIRYDHLVLALSGASGGGDLATLDLADLRAGFDGKFWPHVQAVQAALPRMRTGGSITFITAASARAALPGTAGLAAINGALEAMVPPLATELAPLRVNAVSPGVIDTPWWDAVPSDQRDAIFGMHSKTNAVGRVGTAAEVAAAVVLVATNGFITGTTLECTGGGHLATGR